MNNGIKKTDKHILAIDDNEGIRDSFIMAMEKSAFSIETASTGEEGIESARKRKPDLVFLDLKMPGIDGVETMRLLFEIYPNVKIYILTASSHAFTTQLRKAHADGLLFALCNKPIGAKQIRYIANSIFNN